MSLGCQVATALDQVYVISAGRRCAKGDLHAPYTRYLPLLICPRAEDEGKRLKIHFN